MRLLYHLPAISTSVERLIHGCRPSTGSQAPGYSTLGEDATPHQRRLENLLEGPYVSRPGGMSPLMDGESPHRACAQKTETKDLAEVEGPRLATQHLRVERCLVDFAGVGRPAVCSV